MGSEDHDVEELNNTQINGSTWFGQQTKGARRSIQPSGYRIIIAGIGFTFHYIVNTMQKSLIYLPKLIHWIRLARHSNIY